MKTHKLLHKLHTLLNKHPDASRRNAYVVVTLCEAGGPAREARFCISDVEFNDRHDLLEANEDGPAVEIRIHQNESLRDWREEGDDESEEDEE